MASSDGVALTNVTLSIADSEAVATADGKILIANTNDSALSGVRYQYNRTDRWWYFRFHLVMLGNGQ